MAQADYTVTVHFTPSFGLQVLIACASAFIAGQKTHAGAIGFALGCIVCGIFTFAMRLAGLWVCP